MLRNDIAYQATRAATRVNSYAASKAGQKASSSALVASLRAIMKSSTKTAHQNSPTNIAAYAAVAGGGRFSAVNPYTHEKIAYKVVLVGRTARVTRVS